MSPLAAGGIFTQLSHKLSLLVLVMGLGVYGATQKTPNLDTPTAMNSIDVIENLGGQIPLDLTFTGADGVQRTLKEIFAGDKPIILTLNYYECPMLCTLELNGMVKGLKEVKFTPGEDYRIVTVSIDPAETPELAKSKGGHYRSSFDRATPESWQFFVGDDANVTALAEAVGYQYFYNDRRDEWAHAAAIFVLTPDGRLSRYLYGVEYRPKDLKLSLLEASEGAIGSPMDKVLLFCFHYDPQGKKYAVAAIKVMRLGGALTLLALGLMLRFYWTRERRKRLHNNNQLDAPAA